MELREYKFETVVTVLFGFTVYVVRWNDKYAFITGQMRCQENPNSQFYCGRSSLCLKCYTRLTRHGHIHGSDFFSSLKK